MSPQSGKKYRSPKLEKNNPKQKLYPDLRDLDDSANDDKDEPKDENSEDEVDNYYMRSQRDQVVKGRTSPPRQNKTSANDGNMGRSLLLFAGISCILAGVVYLCLDMFDSSNSHDIEVEQPSIDYFKLFLTKLHYMKSKYNSQTQRFWKTISASLRRQMNSNEFRYPAVIIITVPRDFSDAGTCIARELSAEINQMFNYSDFSYIDVRTINSASPAKTKVTLDEKLSKVLSHGRAVVLDHIEHLPGEAALILHSYADGDNAPYKQAAIFLVFHVNQTHAELKEPLVEKSLTRLWEPVLGGDEMPALLSRIGNNIALMSPEQGIKCN